MHWNICGLLLYVFPLFYSLLSLSPPRLRHQVLIISPSASCSPPCMVRSSSLSVLRVDSCSLRCLMFSISLGFSSCTVVFRLILLREFCLTWCPPPCLVPCVVTGVLCIASCILSCLESSASPHVLYSAPCLYSHLGNFVFRSVSCSTSCLQHLTVGLPVLVFYFSICALLQVSSCPPHFTLLNLSCAICYIDWYTTLFVLISTCLDLHFDLCTPPYGRFSVWSP